MLPSGSDSVGNFIKSLHATSLGNWTVTYLEYTIDVSRPFDLKNVDFFGHLCVGLYSYILRIFAFYFEIT